LPYFVLEKITDLEVRSAIVLLLNSFETALKIIDLKKQNQELKNENAIFKGELRQPDIKPKNKNTNISGDCFQSFKVYQSAPLLIQLIL